MRSALIFSNGIPFSLRFEYVPTQVVAEYFRRVFEDNTGNPVEGILYDSSQLDGGARRAVVSSYR
jgi:hypothetical protein